VSQRVGKRRDSGGVTAETDGMLFDGLVDDSGAVAVAFIDVVLVVDGGTSA
jgi:hypothetical protein